ncbi:MAG: putative ribosome biogenesis GTPase RsgA [Pseudohongiella sp.]|nr:MAG: putative ribosome biogenesis GTPase RsgA [Pseudohongiella sp.]
MSKRRLSKQQRIRIAQNQQNRRENSLQLPTQDQPALESPECRGLIISHFGQQLEIEALNGQWQGKLFRCHQRANLPRLVTGDRVIWQQDDDNTGVVLALEKRRSSLSRPNSLGDVKPIASNVDLIAVIIAPSPEPFANLIDRYLVAIQRMQLPAILVLNKADLLTLENIRNIDNLLAIYRNIGVPTLEVSVQSQLGVDELKRQLEGNTAVFVGQSGVGKSSLINLLHPRANAEVGELSTGKTKGTHTTTTARLFHLKDCDLIDSPGIREFGLGNISQAELFAGFVEFQQYANQCRFRDCSHQSEPDCALKNAVSAGKISEKRLSSYFHILQSMET